MSVTELIMKKRINLLHALGAWSAYGSEENRLLGEVAIDCSDPSITLNECRLAPYCAVVMAPGQSLRVGGKCNSDHDCYPTVRSGSPDPSLVCYCYAGSRFDPFDECEGDRSKCYGGPCRNSCEGLRAYCPAKASQLNVVADDHASPLGECEGNCDSDDDCQDSLYCFKREGGEVVPGCNGIDKAGTNYCISPDALSPVHPTLSSDLRTSIEEKYGNFNECEGSCCNDDECYFDKFGDDKRLTCFRRYGAESVPGCLGNGVFGASYCIRSPCALGYCVYREQPPDPSLVMAYMFAQMRCCDFTDAQSIRIHTGAYYRSITGAAEYCNHIGYDITNCPINKPRYRSFYNVCESDGENGRCASCKSVDFPLIKPNISDNSQDAIPTMQSSEDEDLNFDGWGDFMLKKNLNLEFPKDAQITDMGRNSVAWCCNAKVHGPPSWWLLLRPNGNANQFCMEVGYPIGQCY